MSYEKHMFHLIAEEALRIAEYEDTRDIADEDLFSISDAVARILVDRNKNMLAILAASVTAASLGDMYEVLEELPEAKKELHEYLMNEKGYEFMESDSFSAYVRKDG